MRIKETDIKKAEAEYKRGDVVKFEDILLKEGIVLFQKRKKSIKKK